MSFYLWLNILSISIPFIATFDKRIQFHKTWFALWPSILVTATIFILWDIYFTEWGIWGFNQDHLSGLFLFNLPIEEWLFFITIPYACVFTYYNIKILIRKCNAHKVLLKFSISLGISLIAMGFFHYDKMYTSVTFIAAGLFLLIHLYFFKDAYLREFYLSYIIIYLFPFLLVNGALTGAFTFEPVVWYNNAENLSLRIFTIPVEDFIYGFSLYLMNISIYEWILTTVKSRS